MKSKSKKSKVGKVFGAIGTVVIVLLSIVVGIALVEKFTNKKIIPIQLMWVMTGSMEPTIETESFVLVYDTKDVEVDDIITFYSSDPSIQGELNTHRIVGIDESGDYITKGDNNIKEDDYHVSKDAIVGKVVMSLPILTFFGRLFVTEIGLAIVIVSIIIGFLIISGAVKINIKKKTKQEVIEERIKNEVERLEKEHRENI